MLFKDSNKVKEYTEFTEVNFDSIKLTIRQVEEAEVVAILGNNLYSSLNNAYSLVTNESSLSSANQNLLDKCRMVIAPYLAYNYAPKAEIQLSDSGPRRAETNSVKTAFAYQVFNFREQKLREGETASENLLQFLEDNKTTYTDWVASDVFKDYRSLFIKNGKEFDRYFKSASPYRNYWAWRYKMLDVEEQTIRPALGDALFDYLKSIDADPLGVFLPDEATLMFKIKKAIAYFTVSFAIPFHSVRLDSNGITIISASSTASNKDQEMRGPANADQISQTARNAESSGKSWLQNAVNYILANPTSFPLYPVVPAANNPHYPQNTNNCITGSFGLY